MQRLAVSRALLLLASAPALAQRRGAPPAPPAEVNGYKDPQLATVLGLIMPGAGQIYAGRTAKGAVLLTVSVASPLIGILGAMAMDNGNHGFRGDQFTSGGLSGELMRDRRGGNDRLAPVAAGFGVSAAAWVYGWATAASDARNHNARAGFNRIGALVTPLEGGRSGFGLSVSLP